MALPKAPRQLAIKGLKQELKALYPAPVGMAQSEYQHPHDILSSVYGSHAADALSGTNDNLDDEGDDDSGLSHLPPPVVPPRYERREHQLFSLVPTSRRGYTLRVYTLARATVIFVQHGYAVLDSNTKAPFQYQGLIFYSQPIYHPDLERHPAAQSLGSHIRGPILYDATRPHLGYIRRQLNDTPPLRPDWPSLGTRDLTTITRLEAQILARYALTQRQQYSRWKAVASALEIACYLSPLDTSCLPDASSPHDVTPHTGVILFELGLEWEAASRLVSRLALDAICRKLEVMRPSWPVDSTLSGTIFLAPVSDFGHLVLCRHGVPVTTVHPDIWERLDVDRCGRRRGGHTSNGESAFQAKLAASDLPRRHIYVRSWLRGAYEEPPHLTQPNDLLEGLESRMLGIIAPEGVVAEPSLSLLEQLSAVIPPGVIRIEKMSYSTSPTPPAWLYALDSTTSSPQSMEGVQSTIAVSDPLVIPAPCPYTETYADVMAARPSGMYLLSYARTNCCGSRISPFPL